MGSFGMMNWILKQKPSMKMEKRFGMNLYFSITFLLML